MWFDLLKGSPEKKRFNRYKKTLLHKLRERKITLEQYNEKLAEFKWE